MLRFGNIYFLLFIPILLYLFLKRKNQGTLKFSSVSQMVKEKPVKAYIYQIGRYLIALSFVLMVIGLARPQQLEKFQPFQEGIDIALLLDASGSMESIDFEPNRLEVAKTTIHDFINLRVEDRLALIVFGGSAYTKIPLTLDHQVLEQSLKEITVDSVNEEGTAIGMAISVGVNRLKKSEAASKIMILVTDGDNNAGSINPQTAAGLAKELDIKIYTIGVGTDETILPVEVFGRRTYQQVEGGLNEELLQEIAQTTGGNYYRVEDEKELTTVFTEIDDLEKTKFEENNHRKYEEFGFWFIGASIVTLLLGVFFDKFYFIQIP